jgi:hypothetical protein
MFSVVSDDQISYFSNPNVIYKGEPTGVAGTRDNASVIGSFGCTASNHSSMFDEDFDVSINGPMYGCPNTSQTFSANVTGNGLGALSYEWRMAIGGLNYGPVFSTNSSVTITLPSTPGQMVSLKLKVVSSLQGEKTATNYVGVASCGGFKPGKPGGTGNLLATISTYPNPSQGEVKFEVAVNSDVHQATLTVFDHFGKIVKVIPIEYLSKSGTNTIDGIEELPTGLYYYRLSFGAISQSGKFSVVQ